MSSSGFETSDRSIYLDEEVHYPTRPVDKDKAEQELIVHIEKATSPEESAPKQKHVRKCILFTWDYHSATSFWSGLRVQPILADEIQTFKALITVHKVLQEGHPATIKEAHDQTAWLETCAQTLRSDGRRGYAPLIRTYVQFILAKLRFHRLRPEFNGLFEYDKYVAVKGIDDPNEGYETIADLMSLQDQIESFQRRVFSHLNHSPNNECRVSALVPLVNESWGIYRFVTSMMRAMFRQTRHPDTLEPLRQRYTSQHHSLRQFYYECSNLKYLTGLTDVPKLAQEPPNLLDTGDAPELLFRPKTAVSPPSAPFPDADAVNEQVRILNEYEYHQVALSGARQAAERQHLEREQQQASELQLLIHQQQYSMHASRQASELERELLALRGQWERDQMLLEQYDRRVRDLEAELGGVCANTNSQLASKDDLIKQLQDQITLWRDKCDAVAKLYDQLRTEHLDILSKFTQTQPEAQSGQEAVDRMQKMDRDLKSKNLELADMLRERDRARFDIDRQQSNHKDEIDRLRRELSFANERAEHASRAENSDVSSVLNTYNRQMQELEDSLRAKQIQIDDLLTKANNAESKLERLRDEKDQEIMVLEESMNDTIQRPSDAQQDRNILESVNNTQIDDLILDNQKQLNRIVGPSL
ncbi:ANTH domain-containing protein [Mycena rosella]|uniref:ANTH domain-containing protein n=1 Tax=Mycena rosella TaxID=1033263 RepID=A0AAD7GBQ2_MYCRO|nr:ANTH domain-containing protein [Mycena rosella]